jgi:cytochrome P450
MSEADRLPIPGPSGPEMLANLRLMRSAPPEFLAQCAQRYGPVVRFPLPRAEVLLVTDPADVRRVLQTNHTGYGKHTVQYDSLSLVTGSGLLASEGDVWRRMRRTLAPAFHRDLVAGMAESICATTDAWMGACLTSARDVDLDDAMLDLSLHIVAETLLGTPIEESGRLVQAVMTALRVVVRSAQQPLPIPSSWPTPGNRRLKSSLTVIDAAVTDLIERRRTRPPGADALWLLITAHDEGIASRREVRDEVVTLIVAGHETVAAALTWTWYLLAGHPDVEEGVLAEVDALDDVPGSSWSVARLPYTQAVLDECLRLYPPAWVITRRSLVPDVLSGFEVRAGATLILSPYVNHRAPTSWPEPLRFDPERFRAGRESDVGSGSLTYFPFGAGPRLCIGRDLALLEAPLVLSRLARTFRFRPRRPASMTPDFGVTLRPKGGLPVTIVHR